MYFGCHIYVGRGETQALPLRHSRITYFVWRPTVTWRLKEFTRYMLDMDYKNLAVVSLSVAFPHSVPCIIIQGSFCFNNFV